MPPDYRMEFIEFKIGAIDNLETDDQFGWVPVYLKFRHPHFEAYPTISINVPVQYDRSWTIAKVRSMAFETAHAVLEDAIALFDERGHQLRPEGLRHLDQSPPD